MIMSKTNGIELKKDILYKELRNDILSGKYPDSHKLPKEVDFSKTLGVAQVTLRSALKKLEEEGLVARIPAKGTFVLAPDKGDDSTLTRGNILIVTSDAEKFESPNQYIMPGIESEAALSGFKAVKVISDYITGIDPEEISGIMEKNGITGIIALTNNFLGYEPIIKILHQTKRPVVLPHANLQDGKVTGFATICTPEREAWFEGLKHLCEMGHERIATLTTVGKKTEIRGVSLEEHNSTLESRGVHVDDRLIRNSDYDYEQVETIIDDWMKLSYPPTAIICYSDFFAIHAYKALKRHDIRIPDDMAVMGCCGYPGGKFLNPALSTVDFQYEKLGQTAVNLLAKSKQWFSRDEKIAPPRIIYPFSLIKRASTDVIRIEKELSLNIEN